jgi:hypothetical protein
VGHFARRYHADLAMRDGDGGAAMSTDRKSVEHPVVGVMHHIDRKHWKKLREAVGDVVATDDTSLFRVHVINPHRLRLLTVSCSVA